MNINKKLRLRLTVIATFISLLFFGDIIEAQVHHVKASTRRRTAVVVKNSQQAAAPLQPLHQPLHRHQPLHQRNNEPLP